MVPGMQTPTPWGHQRRCGEGLELLEEGGGGQELGRSLRCLLVPLDTRSKCPSPSIELDTRPLCPCGKPLGFSGPRPPRSPIPSCPPLCSWVSMLGLLHPGQSGGLSFTQAAVTPTQRPYLCFYPNFSAELRNGTSSCPWPPPPGRPTGPQKQQQGARLAWLYASPAHPSLLSWGSPAPPFWNQEAQPHSVSPFPLLAPALITRGLDHF